jgi:hypothetical protein
MKCMDEILMANFFAHPDILDRFNIYDDPIPDIMPRIQRLSKDDSMYKK